MKEATSIIIHSENNTAVKCLTNEQAGILFKGILEYSSSGMPLESTDTALQALFSMFKVQIDRDFKKYSDRCEQNRLNALRRHQNGNNRPQSNTNESDGMPLQANACKNNNNSNDKCKSKNNDDIANAININIESNPSEMQSNGININPRIDKQEKRKRDLAPQLTLSKDLVRLRNEPDNARMVSHLLQKYPTFNEFVIANTPSRQFYLCQNPVQCTYGDSPRLDLLDITYGMFASVVWLVPQIADVSICCGLKEDASEAQIQLVAMAIASRYKYLKTDEVMLFFFNFKAGMYERFYSYFDPQVIVGSVKSFCDERDTIITVHERELQQKRNEENEPKRQRHLK